MPMRPQARRTMVDRFERRVHARRAEFASRWQHAEDLGRRLGHQRVYGIYFQDLSHPGGTALGCLGIFLFVAMFFVAQALTTLIAVPRWVALTAVLGMLGGVVACLNGLVRLHRRSWVYLYPEGLVLEDHRGRLRVHARWGEICGADWIWRSYDDHDGGSIEGYRLRRASGQPLALSVKVCNALDPYAPVGGLLSTLAPRSLGQVLPHFPTLAQALDDLVVGPLARHVAQRWAAGEPLRFGPVHADAAGITLTGKPPLRWEHVAGWQVSDMYLRMRRTDGERKDLRVPLDEVPDGWVLIRAIMERLGPPTPR